ncbi:MAG: NFACT RNA binding domain-containing protein [Candidatus Eremiobacteraeota bacterium]|nr:NFACT RNA binding domain-containing protein [Candidatus Eremiobacteraeota bacterium]
MLTDWLLIRRLAAELASRRSARVQDVGELPDGRLALALWARGSTVLLCVDVFGPTPCVTVEDGDLPVAVEPGFVRAVGAALRGMTFAGARSRRADRLLRLDFTTRSRFGVESEVSLACELVPRFGNIVLLRGDTVVAAAKEFTRAQNAMRSVLAGEPYELPPADPSREIPKLLAQGYGEGAPALIETLVSRPDPLEPLFSYYRDGKLVQTHLVQLPQLATLECRRDALLVDVFARERAGHVRANEHDRSAKRRRDLAKVLDSHGRRYRTELARIDAQANDVRFRDEIRERGDAIFATLHELSPDERDLAKQEASDLFARYKKLGSARDHLATRRVDVAAALEGVDDLHWELERAGDAQLDDVSDAIAALNPKQTGRLASRAPSRKRKPLQYGTRNGSRIYVGRSPAENAHLTFHVARPDDLWFHTQGAPGAHVILARDDRKTVPPEDVAAAAALAAFHSKAKTSPKVTVDFTQRKFVRKRPSAAPGLVFYVNAQSLYVAPADASSLALTSEAGPRTRSS